VVRVATRYLAQKSQIPTDEYIRKKTKDEYLSKAAKKYAANICVRRCAHLQLTGFILQTHPGTPHALCYGASFTFHFRTRRMYVFMHGLESNLMKNLIQNVRNHSHSLETFFLLPSMILELNLQGTLRALSHWHSAVYDIECKTGVRWDAKEESLENLDMTALTRDIKSTTTNLAYWASACQTYQSTLDFLDGIAQQYRTQAILNGLSGEHAARVESSLLEQNEYLRSWLTGMERTIEYLSKRGQAQVQTVRRHSLISPTTVPHRGEPLPR
jgi:hypothetical protein